MSATGPDPARLDELRCRFEDAALASPHISADVIYRPALRPVRDGAPVIDWTTPPLRGFFQPDGVPGAAVLCWTVTAPPYRARTTRPPDDELDLEGIVRDSWSENPRADRPRWWCSLRYSPAGLDRSQFEMLATVAARLMVGEVDRESAPPFAWLVYLAQRAADLAPNASRLVIVTAQPNSCPSVYGVWRDVCFEDCPTELRVRVAWHPAPSWWSVRLVNLFWLSREAIEQVLRSAPADVSRTRKSGRPPDPEKGSIVAHVRELKAANKTWKEITTSVRSRWPGKDYSTATLQKYLRDADGG